MHLGHTVAMTRPFSPFSTLGSLGLGRRWGSVAVWLLAATALWAVAPTQASERDHDRARAALAAGEVLPLRQLLQQLGPQLQGEVLEVELERDHGRWVYELKLLQPGGQLRKLKVDARSGELLRSKAGGAAR